MDQTDHDTLIKITTLQHEMYKKVGEILLEQEAQRKFCMSRTTALGETTSSRPTWGWLLTVCGSLLSATLLLFGLLFVNHTTDIINIQKQISDINITHQTESTKPSITTGVKTTSMKCANNIKKQ